MNPIRGKNGLVCNAPALLYPPRLREWEREEIAVSGASCGQRKELKRETQQLMARAQSLCKIMAEYRGARAATASEILPRERREEFQHRGRPKE